MISDRVQKDLESDSRATEDLNSQVLNDCTAQKRLNKMNDLTSLSQHAAEPGQTSL